VKSHTGKGTPLQGAGLDRWPWDGDELNRPLLDGDWLGETSLDHLLGDVELARLLLNNVGHASWVVQDRDALVQLVNWGWDNGLAGANLRLVLELLLKWSWDARDDVVLEELDNSQDPSLRVLLDELLSNNWVQLLTAHHNLHWQGQGVGWDHLDFSDAREDLDHLLLALNSLGGDGNWDVPGAVHKKTCSQSLIL